MTNPAAASARGDGLHILILGAAAGGGFPQWNCACPGCRAARSGGAPGSGQFSMALSADGRDWVLINAAPEILQQIRETPALHPHAGQIQGDGLRHSPISAVVLTNAEIDAVAGLLSLREGGRFALWASETVHEILVQNSLFAVLRPENVSRPQLVPDQPFTVAGLEITAFTVPGTPAWYLRDHKAPDAGDTLALEIRTAGRRAVIIPACAGVTGAMRDRIEGADILFFDGTLWRDDEMIRAGLAQKTGASMGHMSISGPDGAIAALSDLQIGRRVFVHINNSNPVLLPSSSERRALGQSGWEVGEKGARYTLCSI
ncbi:pyrroloquinoline quinone biosynthesis protein PqqB [Xinfangfangia sp. D13-10-4-6]|uniref:pyrroloquinoline quinone biosynthesis protein PqqB n=1 Tax=Pseudogemmobacter hezensis TaxID=2737662 RepID=UPI00155546D5|nr:pyrroloquinoline quinone biosynthesis protein PqqB [Pseudogemmobacter hezensis]NPD14822.1 pyrroloquinoline quinone biosynthesis protein PqqB [Pseudogemmobacter hezensis]